MKALLVVLSALVVLSSFNVRAEQQNKSWFDTTVFFLAPDGTPAANEEILVFETFSGRRQLTDVRDTDGQGALVLRGEYCADVVIQAYGGQLLVAPWTSRELRLTSFRPQTSWIPVRPKRQELDAFKKTKQYETCTDPAGPVPEPPKHRPGSIPIIG